MDKIATTKRAVQHKAWAEMYAAYQASGKTMREWCSEQGIVIKTFYYRLCKLREAGLEKQEQHQIVPIATQPINILSSEPSGIKISGNGIMIELPESISAETITAVLKGLQ